MLRRSDFAIGAILAGIAAAAPRAARASNFTVQLDPADAKKETAHAKSSPEHEGPTTAQYLSFNTAFKFESPDIAQVDWKTHWPQGGTGTVLVDAKGNWSFTGSFPSQPDLKYPNRISLTFVLAGDKKNGIGQAIAITKVMTVGKSGATWSKTGKDQVVADIWTDIANGHTHQWLEHAHPERPSDPPPADPPPSHSSSSSGSSCDPVGAFFTGGLSCL